MTDAALAPTEAERYMIVGAHRDAWMAAMAHLETIVAHARKGNGPTLIECIASGLNGRPIAAAGSQPGHRRADADSGDDPILNMERYLAFKGLFDDQLKARIISAFARDMDAAIRAAAKPPTSKRVK